MADELSDASTLVLIGIGGSDLGTLAIYEAIFGRDGNTPKRLLAMDTTDALHAQYVLGEVQTRLELGEKIACAVISKSGSTIETIANASTVIDLLMRFGIPSQYVVCITDANSALASHALHHGYSCLTFPSLVGGRYSVLSAVGAFPLVFLGVNVTALRLGAKKAIQAFIDAPEDHPAPALATTLANFSQGKSVAVVDTFSCFRHGESLGRWYRQLLGESLGKAITRSGKTNTAAFVPTVSIGSTDLHSMGQLYLSPLEGILHVVLSTADVPEVPVPNTFGDPLGTLVNGRSFGVITDSIVQGFCGALLSKNKPFVQVHFDTLDELSLGEYLATRMLEVMLLAAMLDINAFDQPNVEDYKIITKKVLA